MIRVESLGSVWLIDEEREQYMRMPKTEGPRSDPNEERELADLVWLPYIEWEVGKRVVWARARRVRGLRPIMFSPRRRTWSGCRYIPRPADGSTHQSPPWGYPTSPMRIVIRR